MVALSSLPVVNAVLDLRNQQCQSNREAWLPVLEKFETALREVSGEGDPKSLSRQQQRGQLLGLCSHRCGKLEILTRLQLETASRFCWIMIRRSSSWDLSQVMATKIPTPVPISSPA